MRTLLILMTIGINSWAFGQNLVPNPSFEDTIGCPLGLSDLSKTTYWTTPTLGSPDYFNSCNSTDASVPNNIFGNQDALSGDGYVGFSIYDTWTSWSYREYIQVPLTQTLSSGQQYWVSFFVSLSDSSFFGIQELGAHFSSSEISDNSMDTTLPLIPQIQFSDSVITDKDNWIKVSGSFIANGDESHLLIGNFNLSQNTTATGTFGNQNYSYYYIDNVCVSSDSLTCSSFVGLTESVSSEEDFRLYPNPATDFIIIQNDNKLPFDIEVYDSMGELLYKEAHLSAENLKLDIKNYESGLLFIKIITDNNQHLHRILNE